MAAGVIAANLPDIDLLYSGITPAPLGYLLHHRGHTHTIAGLIALGGLMAIGLCLAPAARGAPGAARARLIAAVAVNLLLHVALDGLNTYGVHPFYPFETRWYFGDAVFIFEPWFWLLLGVAATWNARSRLTSWVVGGTIGALIVAVTALGAIPGVALAALVVAGGGLVRVAPHLTPVIRSASALAAGGVGIGGLIVLSQVASARAVRAVDPDQRAGIIDVIVNPNPANPACWAVVVLRRDDRADELVLRRGTLSLLPQWQLPAWCASAVFGTAGAEHPRNTDAMGWGDEFRQPLAQLRGLHARDCWTRAWLQFGRAPMIRDGAIVDRRFDTGVRVNFTTMPLREPGSAPCPSYLTPWTPPRGDILK